jgi:hypothetical protein
MDIKLLDNCLPIDLLVSCIKDAECSANYSVLNGAGDGSYGFKYRWLFKSEQQDQIENNNLKNLWGKIKEHLPSNSVLHRGYINAHTYGVEDSIHEDDADLEKGLTVIVYLCSDWYPEWFGQTMFFSSLDKHNNEIVGSVIPKFNRVIVFDKAIPHCVAPLSRRFAGVRLTCMFKVKLLNESA